ncbi:MAG: histidine phosphatase family protein [bacterium]
MKLIVVRHGESKGNTSDLVQGAESKLSNEGCQQAQRLADKLKDEQIDAAFVSPLFRAQQTANIILRHHPGLGIQTVPELRERDYGIYEGRPASEPQADWRASGLPFGEFKPEGGESWYEAGERATSFIRSLIDRYKDSDQTILVVGHGSIFTYFLTHMDGKDVCANSKEQYDYYHPHNTAMSVIEVDATGHYQLTTLNDISHLD